MDVKFGTSGLRGPAGDLLAGAAASHIAAFCELLLESSCNPVGNSVYIGRDLRVSSASLAAQCAAAVSACRLQPVDCGTVPTPALAEYAMNRNCAAIMVTGSHIPADRNGLKFYLPTGEITKADEANIAARLAAPRPAPQAPPPSRPDCLRTEVLAAWKSRYADLLAPDALRHLRLHVHEHSSVATGFLADLLAGFGAATELFGRADEFVPLDTEAVEPRFLELYASRIRRHRLDGIASADPDGDRPLLVDETGTPLRGDLLGWITAHWLGADSVAVPVTANSAIRSRPGLEVVRTKVGSPHVIASMQAALGRGARLAVGFEANGGFLLGSRARPNGVPLAALPTRDSVLPILATLQFAAGRRLPLSALEREFGFGHAVADRLVDFSADRSQALMAWLAADPGNIAAFLAPLGPVGETDWTDGLRITLAGGNVVHFRPSGNAPEMRCYCEGSDRSEAMSLLGEGLRRLADWRR